MKEYDLLLNWSIVSSPGENLSGIAAISASDIWAVGYQLDHWDGSSWTIVSSVPSSSFLFGITALASNDVWAVGYDAGSPLTEHWDGSQWSIIPGPSQVCGALTSATAITSKDVWVAGSHGRCSSRKTQTLTEQWDGTQWHIIKSPLLKPAHAGFQGTIALSASDIWAVGYDAMGKSHAQTITEHWDGTTWSVVASPDPSQNFNFLFGVAGVGSELWAVGYSGGSTYQTLVEFYC